MMRFILSLGLQTAMTRQGQRDRRMREVKAMIRDADAAWTINNGKDAN